MAVSTTYSNYDLTFENVVRLAFQMAGVLGAGETPSAAEQVMAGQLLNLGLKEWQALSRMVRYEERVTKTLTPGTATFTIDADTIDIEEPAYITLTDESDHLVRAWSQDDYMAVSKKDQEGIPNRMLIERQATMAGRLYPVPNDQCVSITYVRVKLMRDADTTFTVDAHQRQLMTIVRMLAVELASHYKMSPVIVDRLERRFKESMRDLMRDSKEKGDVRFVL